MHGISTQLCIPQSNLSRHFRESGESRDKLEIHPYGTHYASIPQIGNRIRYSITESLDDPA